MKRLDIGEVETTYLAKALRKVEFFRGLSVSDLDQILRYVQLYRFDPDEYVFKKGDPGDSFYVMQKGEVEVCIKKSFFSPVKRIETLGPGQFFGEMALVNKKRRSASIRALKTSHIFTFLGSDFDQIFESNPTFKEEMERLVTQRKFQNKRLEP